MPDTIQNITIPQNQWVDLYALSSIAVGTQITVENTGDIDIYLSVQAAQPAIGTDNYNILARNNGVRLQNTKDDLGAWAYCNGSDGKINLSPNADCGFTAETKPVITQSKSILDMNSGRAFYGTHIARAVQDNGIVETLVSTGSKEASVNFSAKTIGDYETHVYEGVTTSDDGVAETGFNIKRSDTTSTIETVVYETPTIIDDGQLIIESLAHGGEKHTAIASDSDSMLILRPNTKYLLRMHNTSGNIVDMSFLWRLIEQ